MKERLSALFVLLAAAAPGLLFAPVFGLWSLVVPVAAVLVACYAAVELALRVPAVLAWRPLVALVLGLLAVTWTELGATTAAGLPTGSTIRALSDGVTQSWQLTLQSTWPARPDAQLILFIPLALLVAAVLGLELRRWALAALLPSVLLLGLSQAYVAITGRDAAIAALGYALVAAGLLAVSREAREHRATRRVGALTLIAPTIVLAVAGALVVTWADPVRPAVSLQQNHSVPLPPNRYTSPLDEIAERELKPAVPVFDYKSNGPDDLLWRMAVLDEFDGATWKAPQNNKRMGSTVAPTGAVTQPTKSFSATIEYPEPDGPWLPSQLLPDAVSGVAPLIDPDTGVLQLHDPPTGPVNYKLSWREPDISGPELNKRGIDARAASGLGGVGAIPPEVSALAEKAVGKLRASFQTASALSRYMSANYSVATGKQRPTGAGWPQLGDFLLHSHRGTSQQFAAGYVVLARSLGIPARIAVGYHGTAPGPDGISRVHNSDVFAWPEVAVDGVGWVPLDPTATAKGAGSASSGGLAAAAADARDSLPPQQELEDPKLPPTPQVNTVASGDRQITIPWLVVLLVVVLLIVLALVAVPVLKLVRGWRRRRLRGARGVVAAWTEARDLLRAHGVAVTSGMTVRELAEAAQPLGSSITEALARLAELVDAVLWSGGDAPPEAVPAAWASVKEVRRGLAGRGARQRVRAALHLDSLRPLGLPTIVGSRASAGRLPA